MLIGLKIGSWDEDFLILIFVELLLGDASGISFLSLEIGEKFTSKLDETMLLLFTFDTLVFFV